MAARSTTAPRQLSYAPPAATGWTLADRLEFQRFTDRLNLLLAEGTTASGGGGGGGGGGTVIPPGTVVLPTAKETHWHFPNPAAGIVLLGRTNATQWRLWVEDEFANENSPSLDNPEIRFESGSTPVHGDWRFTGAYSGPVLRGRFRDGIYRLFMDDEDATAPHLRFEKINVVDINSGDLEFAFPGVSFVNKGRTYFHRWEWYIDNEAGGLFLDANIRLERYDG